ncbi:hypothetical protein EV11_0914 [Prochlorococcus sp. SS52]|nr:hypothetical protein EV04_0244 [Prochlorococcus marinus str. LG]KGG22035.1 hypothetical protein EV08_0209 [Prochlorococcus marinus str. SS2]KGG24647.1 hypothetical protein EV09_0279 [Prochlorococcus marinus str. SS35]KGG33540.1 hypothetical protein EV10_0749 [Prochlorococcus marinus str. SS51]KGG36223.1 hypothetical protein EV11_0914 [Prochlorococcus sp. SS52]
MNPFSILLAVVLLTLGIYFIFFAIGFSGIDQNRKAQGIKKNTEIQ